MTLQRCIQRVTCWWRGHRGGRRMTAWGGDTISPVRRFQCTKCGAEWEEPA